MLFCNVQFKDVIGQLVTKQQLVNMYQQNRLSHALLFLGKEGAGGLSLARAFAQYIVCEQINGKGSQAPQTDSLFGEDVSLPVPAKDVTESCGLCPACQKAAKLIHPDIHYSYPVITKKPGEPPLSSDYAVEWRDFILQNPYGNTFDWLQHIHAENKQGNISVKECDEINRKLSLKSFESEYKILIMWMPEFLGKEGNKLLKLIEEPPPNTIFLFVAESQQLILQTILSRTQLVKIPLLQHEDIVQHLTIQKGINSATANSIATISDGNYREALEYLVHADENWEVILRDWLNAIVKSGPTAQVKWVDDISKIGREKQKKFLKYFTQLLEYAIRIRTIGSIGTSTDMSNNDNQQSFLDFAVRFNKLCDFSQQEAIIKELDTAAYHVERNANAKILFHALTIKLYHIISNKSVILVS